MCQPCIGPLASQTLVVGQRRPFGGEQRLKRSESTRLCPFAPHRDPTTLSPAGRSGRWFSESPTLTPQLWFPSSATERFDRTNETTERSRSGHHYLRPGGWGMTWELRSRHVTPRAFETRVHRTVCRPLHCHEQTTQSVPIASYHEVCSPQNQLEVFSAAAEPFTHQPVGSTPQDVRIHLRSGTSEFQGTKRRRSVRAGHYDASALPDLQLFLVHAYCEDERLSTTCGSVLATC